MSVVSRHKLSDIIYNIEEDIGSAQFIIDSVDTAMKLVTMRPSFFSHIPEKLITDDVVIAALSNEIYTVSNATLNKYITRDIIKKVLEKNGYNICNIPKQFLDYGLCKIAVDQDPFAILYISDMNYITEELFKVAVKSNPRILLHLNKDIIQVSNGWITPDIIELINTLDDIKIFQSPMLRFMSAENMLRIIKSHDDCIFISDAKSAKLHTEEMYLELIKVNKGYIQYFKPNVVSKEFLQKHILSDESSTNLGVHLLTEDMFTLGIIFNLISKEIPEGDTASVLNRLNALRYVPKIFFSYDNYVLAVNHNVMNISELPLDIKKRMLLEGLEEYNKE